MTRRCKVLVVDPPWKFGDGLQGKRGAKHKYKCMTLDKIKRFGLPPLARDCVLFMWRVAAMQEEAHAVIRAWGFTPGKGEIVWRKLTKNGKEHFGMGRIVRGSHETCLIATRGRPKRKHARQRSLFSARMPLGRNGRVKHSAKPDEFYALVRELYAGPRVALFEREHRDGFECHGNQLRRKRRAAA